MLGPVLAWGQTFGVAERDDISLSPKDSFLHTREPLFSEPSVELEEEATLFAVLKSSPQVDPPRVKLLVTLAMPREFSRVRPGWKWPSPAFSIGWKWPPALEVHSAYQKQAPRA